MREMININDDWSFGKDTTKDTIETAEIETVNLPHTWNAVDGQDGGNDYWRGTSTYQKKLDVPALAEDEELWLEINGANSSSDVYLNGKKLAHHDGGYSTYRVNLTDELADGDNILTIEVDNAPNNHVYPQNADFTFYGGLYRDVNLVKANKAHFALGYWGGLGLKITPVVKGDGDGVLVVEAFTENAKDGDIVDVVLLNAEGVEVARNSGVVKDNEAKVECEVKDIHLWDGVDDSYLYTAKAALVQDGKAVDELRQRIGFRTFEIDPEKGFILNGRPYQLIGAGRHQDKMGIGNALTNADHDEDFEILREMGVNTIRGAHYQHNQRWYDDADEAGIIMWAEIPYITAHMPGEEACQNTKDQMKELIVQNYNHPSICVWSLSNEITIRGQSEEQLQNHKELNDLVHSMDSTRKTVMAHVNSLSPDSPLVHVTDASSYNLYFGWYLGRFEDNDAWFDNFHASHPDIPIGLSEFGSDANPQYQSEKPGRGDYTEAWQALYHEHILMMLEERPWIWATHVWNGFDFAADARNEGGKPGQNQKGLVTFDRKIKKDAFYVYKAYLSKEPFVYLAGRRYADRENPETEIKVYSNEPEVTLYVDGEKVSTQPGHCVFKWNIPISGEHKIKAVGSRDDITDEIVIRKVEEKNPDYIVEGGTVHNWFDDEIEKSGYLSIMDSFREVLAALPESEEILKPLLDAVSVTFGYKDKSKEDQERIMEMMLGFPVERGLRMAGDKINKDQIIELNKQLNTIPRKA